MQFTISAAMAISLASFTLASPFSLVERQNGVTCQTSSGSPTTEDVTLVINELNGRGGDCAQTNGVASECTTLVDQDSAAIAVCGGVDDDASTLSCIDVAGFANQIQQTCQSNGLAGGTYTVSASKRIVVIHS